MPIPRVWLVSKVEQLEGHSSYLLASVECAQRSAGISKDRGDAQGSLTPHYFGQVSH